MSSQTRSLSEINDLAVRMLVRELGPADAARFLNQFSVGNGDYTEERKEQFKGLTVDEIVKAIQGRSKAGI